MTLDEILQAQLSIMRETNATELTCEYKNEAYKLTLTLSRK